MDRVLNFLRERGAVGGFEIELSDLLSCRLVLPPDATTRLACRSDPLVTRLTGGSRPERPASFGNQLAAKSLYFRPNLSMLSPAQHFIQFLQ